MNIIHVNRLFILLNYLLQFAFIVFSLFLIMQTLEIQVPDDKTNMVKDFLKDLGVKVKIKKTAKIPNAETIAAIAELKNGKGLRFNSVEELFNSI